MQPLCLGLLGELPIPFNPEIAGRRDVTLFFQQLISLTRACAAIEAIPAIGQRVKNLLMGAMICLAHGSGVEVLEVVI
jgi:hypothetical protein